MRNMSSMGRDIQLVGEKVAIGINGRIPKLIGEMLVDEFRESFDLQRFNDDGSTKWKQVKRRTVGSRWYGFQYGTNGAVPVGSRGYTKTGKPRRYGTRGGKTNYSSAATTRNILLGSGSVNLQDSIYLHSAARAQVIVATDQPHAQVHNEDLEASVFGRRKFKMPKRKFMGHSKKSDREAKQIIDRYFNTVLR